LSWSIYRCRSVDRRHDTLYFAALADAPSAAGLWKVNVSGVATRVISDPVTSLARCGIALYFTAVRNGECDVYKIDGATGVTRLTSIVPRPNALPPLAFTQVGDKVFFVVRDVAHGEEPWVTDGTPQGTHIVKDVNPGRAIRSTTSPCSTACTTCPRPTVCTGASCGGATHRAGHHAIDRSTSRQHQRVISLLLQATDDAIYFSGTDPNAPGKWTVWKTDARPTTPRR
jgi:ELWxxDGT repeat protein